MNAFSFDILGKESLDKAAEDIYYLNQKMPGILKQVSNRASSHLQTNSAKVIRERYAISQANIRANRNVKIFNYYSQNRVSISVNFFGFKIPLYRFAVSPKSPTQDTSKLVSAMVAEKWKKVHPGMTSRAHVFKVTPYVRFNDIFVAEMKSGHVGLFERTGEKTSKGSDAIEEKMGLSVPQMLGSDEVKEKLAKEASEKFEQRLDHEILRILNGFGR